MRTGLLEHDDSLLVPRATREAKGGLALSGEGAAHLHQRWPTELDGVQEARHSECEFSRWLLGERQFKFRRSYWGLQESHVSRGTDSDAPQQDSVQART